MKKILGLLLLITIFGCSTEKDCCVNYDTAIDIRYQNENGENLFETNTLKFDEIEVYQRTDNGWKKNYNGNMDAPKGISLIDNNGSKVLRLYPSEIFFGNNNFSETKLEFSNDDFDIIRTEMNKGNNTIVTKVWYNNELKWSSNSNSTRQLTIVK